MKNQLLFFNQSKKRGQRANHCSQNWRGRQAERETHSLPEQKPTSTFFYRNQCLGRKTSTVINELLETQCGKLWKLKSPKKPSQRGPMFCEFCLQKLYKILTMNTGESFLQEDGEKTILEYTRRTDISVLLIMGCPQENLFHQSLICWGFNRA